MPKKPDKKPNLWYRFIKVFFQDTGSVVEIDYEELDIYFRISRTQKRDSDKCDIEIYDLGKDIRQKINQNCTVIVYGGYTYGKMGVIFKGSVLNVYTVEGGTDCCTYVKAIDNTRTAIDTYYKQRTYKKDTKFIDIVLQEINDWNKTIQEDPRFSPTYSLRKIAVGDMEDPNEYYGTDRFKLDKDETKTQTPYGVIWDIVDRTNGYIWAGEDSTQYHKEWKKEALVSWTFYLNEDQGGQAYANFVHTEWVNDADVTLDAENGLIEIAPNDYIEKSAGWSGKCLLNVDIKIDGKVKCIPARKKEWGPVTLRIKELVHEHADGGVYYTSFKGEVENSSGSSPGYGETT